MMKVLCIIAGLALVVLGWKMIPSIVRYTRISRM